MDTQGEYIGPHTTDIDSSLSDTKQFAHHAILRI